MKLALTAALMGVVATGCAVAEKQTAVDVAAVIDTYGDIAEAGYSDSLATAKVLRSRIDALLAAPGPETLAAARSAWIAARVPYQQTEVYRFGNAIVDDWEGKVNAWPLDEGLIDYVDSEWYGEESEENPAYVANVIANPTLMIGGKTIDASVITPALLADTLQEADGVEANVATGYHAIEFLLWGQDLNGTNKGAGNRPASDFSLTDCSGGHCERRRQYLVAATDLLISDLEEMVANWQDGGAARTELMANGEKAALATMLTGMGSLSYGELAGERTKLGLMLHDPEEEHDCFSDNTHASHFYDAKGIRNVFQGAYRRVDGSTVSGASLEALLQSRSPAAASALAADLAATEAAMQVMFDHGEQGETFDVLIASGNSRGNAVVQKAVDSLVVQTRSIEGAIKALELDAIELEGSDSLDNPTSVGAS